MRGFPESALISLLANSPRSRAIIEGILVSLPPTGDKDAQLVYEIQIRELSAILGEAEDESI